MANLNSSPAAHGRIGHLIWQPASHFLWPGNKKTGFLSIMSISTISIETRPAKGAQGAVSNRLTEYNQQL